MKSIKLINFDPTKYVRNQELLTNFELNESTASITELRNSLGFSDDEFLQELSGADSKLVFTDELK